MPNIHLEFDGIDKALKTTSPKTVAKATRSSLNKLAKTVKTTASLQIRKDYNIKKKDLDRKVLKIIKAQAAQQSVTIEATGRSLSLAFFNARQTSGTRLITRTKRVTRKRRAKFQGVTVTIRKGKKTFLPGSFLSTVVAGRGSQKETKHIGVFARAGKERLPIFEKRMVSVPSLFGNKSTMAAMEKKVSQAWPVIFERELKFFISKVR